MSEDGIDASAELDALKQVASALAGLDDAAVQRVLRWAADRFGVSGVVQMPDAGVNREGGESHNRPPADQEFEDVASLFSAANPMNDADKALVVGYWMQYVEGTSEFESFALNKHLKQLGHGISNITGALETLKARKPQLVIQTKKSGTSRQARKKFKLTNAGKLAVQDMLQGE